VTGYAIFAQLSLLPVIIGITVIRAKNFNSLQS